MRDADRPPVQAHLRFAARRSDFAGLDLAARFDRIHATNLWGAPGSVSGLGSEAAATVELRSGLPSLLRTLGVRSLLDAPCGDAGWIHQALPDGVAYVGIDIVPGLIEALRRRGAPGRYLLADITRSPLPRADAILCRDALVHLSFANIARAVANMRRSGATWLIATTFPLLQENRDCEDGDWRALNMARAPFHWPAPEAVLTEGCEEAGGGWRDKSLAAWRLEALPLSGP